MFYLVGDPSSIEGQNLFLDTPLGKKTFHAEIRKKDFFNPADSYPLLNRRHQLILFLVRVHLPMKSLKWDGIGELHMQLIQVFNPSVDQNLTETDFLVPKSFKPNNSKLQKSQMKKTKD